jgi:hypothetical protein
MELISKKVSKNRSKQLTFPEELSFILWRFSITALLLGFVTPKPRHLPHEIRRKATRHTKMTPQGCYNRPSNDRYGIRQLLLTVPFISNTIRFIG